MMEKIKDKLSVEELNLEDCIIKVSQGKMGSNMVMIDRDVFCQASRFYCPYHLEMYGMTFCDYSKELK
jgi:hypothetical protein